MASLSRGQIFEVVFWIAFAIGAFAMSFSFNQEIEIYRFGASTWPRVVLILIVVAAIGQLVQDLRKKEAGAEQARGEDTAEQSEHGTGYVLRLGITLLLPVVYASLLDTTGFYFTTPIFILLYLFVTGERRITWLIGIPVLIHALLILFFAKLLRVGLPVGYAEPFYSFSNWLLVMIQ